MATKPLDTVNGYTIKEMIALVVLPKLDELGERIDKIHTPDSCPLRVEVKKNSSFRIRGIAVLGVIVLTANIAVALVVHFL